jgi:hypothetical protein
MRLRKQEHVELLTSLVVALQLRFGLCLHFEYHSMRSIISLELGVSFGSEFRQGCVRGDQRHPIRDPHLLFYAVIARYRSVPSPWNGSLS